MYLVSQNLNLPFNTNQIRLKRKTRLKLQIPLTFYVAFVLEIDYLNHYFLVWCSHGLQPGGFYCDDGNVAPVGVVYQTFVLVQSKRNRCKRTLIKRAL